MFKLIEVAHYCYFKKNNIIIREGDIDNKIYVLMSGLVSYHRKGNIKYIKVGKCFGKVVNPRNSQILYSKYNYKAEDDCEILSIPYSSMNEIIIKPLKTDFLHKINLINKIECIKNGNPYTSVILALIGSHKIFDYEEVILKQNTHPKEFYIIEKGQCKCIYDTVMVRTEETKDNKLKEISNPKQESCIPNNNRNYSLVKLKNISRSFNNDQIELRYENRNRKIAYRVHVFLGYQIIDGIQNYI